jgi:hypothetical protein
MMDETSGSSWVLVDTTKTACYGKSRDDQNQRLKGALMFSPALPLDYVKHIDRGDRIRRLRTRPSGSRMRRGKAATAQ